MSWIEIAWPVLPSSNIVAGLNNDKKPQEEKEEKQKEITPQIKEEKIEDKKEINEIPEEEKKLENISPIEEQKEIKEEKPK